jgi:hypothetical protein
MKPWFASMLTSQFLTTVHELFKAQGSVLSDGYAPFCKHIFVENFVGAKLGALKITESNRGKLHSGKMMIRSDTSSLRKPYSQASGLSKHFQSL